VGPPARRISTRLRRGPRRSGAGGAARGRAQPLRILVADSAQPRRAAAGILRAMRAPAPMLLAIPMHPSGPAAPRAAWRAVPSWRPRGRGHHGGADRHKRTGGAHPMQFFLDSPLAALALVAILAFFVYTGIKVGPTFLVKRLAGLVFVIIGVTFITFLLGFWGAGPNGYNVVVLQCGIHCNADPSVVPNLENFYGLRDPWYQQYAHFLNNLAHFTLGYSYNNRERLVNDILASGVPVSVDLQVEAITLQLVIGIPIGIISALRSGSRFDTASNTVSLMFYSVPAYLVILIFQVVTVNLALHNLPHLPVFGWDGPFSITAIAPVTIVALVGMAYFVRLTRTTMLETLGQDYIRTARAKGLRERVVVYRHAFRNAVIPLITALGPILAFSVVGAFFTETFFQIPGIGFQAVQAIQTRDLPVIQGTVLLTAIAVVVMNLVADVTYGVLDPRIKVA
jgi:ABC-type dipeptide/oligopeptide/nickel transport system permease component